VFALTLPASTATTPALKVQFAMARRVDGVATLGVGDGVGVAVTLEVRDALGDAPGSYTPLMNTSSNRKVDVLQK
jgi:hypothetical protein